MLTLTSAELNTWIAALMWPLTRILALLAASPIFGNARIPPTVTVPFGLIMAILIAPAVPAMPAADPFSWAGLLIIAREIVIGMGMGFAIRVVFAAVEMAGEISSLTMGNKPDGESVIAFEATDFGVSGTGDDTKYRTIATEQELQELVSLL